MNGKADQGQQPAVVVVGLDCITGLQTARVFARRNVPVVGIAQDAGHFCCRTRVCSKIVIADTAGQGLTEALRELGPTLSQPAVLIPCTDNSVLQIAADHDQLGAWYRVAQPQAGVVELLTDKSRFPEFAAQHGLPIPISLTLASLADAQSAASKVTYPVVLKPPVKTTRWQEHTRAKAIIVDSAEQLVTTFQEYSAWSPTLLLQEWIPGPLQNHYTCDAYFDAGSQPLVTFTSQKMRQWPVKTGVGSISQECDSPDVRRETIRLFQAADFHGLAYVEMKRHEVTGEYLIIEPNVGRPTGRSTCAEAAGVEMLYTMYCDLAGLPLPAKRQQQFTEMKWIYWKRDLRAAWSGWRRGELTFGKWWRSIRGRKACAVFSWSDPGPFLADWWRAVRKSATARPKSNEAVRETSANVETNSDTAYDHAIAVKSAASEPTL